MRTQEKDLENGGSEKVGTEAAGMRELSDDKSRRFRAGRGRGSEDELVGWHH